jgi:hypothetical protein
MRLRLTEPEEPFAAKNIYVNMLLLCIYTPEDASVA